MVDATTSRCVVDGICRQICVKGGVNVFEITMMATKMNNETTDIEVAVYENVGNIIKKNFYAFTINGVYKSITPELEEIVRQVLIENGILQQEV